MNTNLVWIYAWTIARLAAAFLEVVFSVLLLWRILALLDGPGRRFLAIIVGGYGFSALFRVVFNALILLSVPAQINPRVILDILTITQIVDVLTGLIAFVYLFGIYVPFVQAPEETPNANDAPPQA